MSKSHNTPKARTRTGGTVATPESKIAEAIAAAGGHVADAARKLGINRSHLHRCIAKSDELKRVLEEARDELLDEAETALRDLIKAGDVQAVIFTLRTLGKKRGYTLNEAPAVTVNTNTVVNAGFGENPERQAKLKAAYDRIRESAAA